MSWSFEILWKDCWGFSFCKHLPGLTWLDKFEVWCSDVLYGKSLISCIMHSLVLQKVWQIASFYCWCTRRTVEDLSKRDSLCVLVTFGYCMSLRKKFRRVYLNTYISIIWLFVSNMPIYADYIQSRIRICLRHACHGWLHLPQPLRHLEDTASANWWRSRRAKGKAHLVASPSDLRAGLKDANKLSLCPAESLCILCQLLPPLRRNFSCSFRVDFELLRWISLGGQPPKIWFSQAIFVKTQQRDP